MAIDLAGIEKVQDFLTEEAVRRQNVLADAAEKEKFG
jgi:hypothetical protein